MGDERKRGISMILYATLYDNRNNKLFDISKVIGKLTLSSYIEDNPSKCTFTIIKTDGLEFWEGATVSVEVDGYGMFRGFVFTKKRTKDTEIIEVTCYDQLRYLKNKDSKVFENMTSDQIFSKLCDDFVLRHRVVDKSSYVCAPRSHADSTTLYEMIKYSLDDTLINSKRWFIVRDNFGVLEHISIRSLVSPYILGDRSGVTGFDYETSIDKDVYNQIKLYRDNTDTGKRDVFIVNDTINGGSNLRAWGILQYHSKVEDNLNLAQIEQRALGILSLYNNVNRKLRLACLGIPSIFAGSIFNCKISDLGDISLDSNLLVTDCTHNIENNVHTMELTTEVIL